MIIREYTIKDYRIRLSKYAPSKLITTCDKFMTDGKFIDRIKSDNKAENVHSIYMLIKLAFNACFKRPSAVKCQVYNMCDNLDLDNVYAIILRHNDKDIFCVEYL